MSYLRRLNSHLCRRLKRGNFNFFELTKKKEFHSPATYFGSDCIVTKLARRMPCIVVVHGSDLDGGNVLHLEVKSVLLLCSFPSLYVFLIFFNSSHSPVTTSFQGLRASPQYHFFPYRQ